MGAVFGLLLLLIGGSYGLKSFCDGRKDGAKCYGALGGTLIVKLMDDTSEIFKYQWLNKTSVILNARKKMVVYNLIGKRASYSPSDGTFRIKNLSPAEGGEYAFEIFNSHGYKLVHQTLHLIIQAPVSSVRVASKCLSHRGMRVVCSSEGGDNPHYSWTLNGQTVKDSQLLYGHNKAKNITLKYDVSGRLVCSVSNHISRISACGFIYINCTLPDGKRMPNWVIRAKDNKCVEPTKIPIRNNTEDYFLLHCEVISALIILISIGIAIFFIRRRKDLKEAECSAVTEMMDDQNPRALVVQSKASVFRLYNKSDYESWPL